MAGVDQLPSGEFRGWFINWQGKRERMKVVAGATRKEVKNAAQAREHNAQLIRSGQVLPPRASEKAHLYEDLCGEYFAWGKTQGKRKGRGGWSADHLDKKRTKLEFWGKRLGLEFVSDLAAASVFARVEQALRDLATVGLPGKKSCKGNPIAPRPLSGKTTNNYLEALTSFCEWCSNPNRRYLDEHPLKGMEKYANSESDKRALTPDEIHRLLERCYAPRRIIYETALSSGLRANELRALQVKHLDTIRGGVILDALFTGSQRDEKFTKNRKGGFQPLPAWLVEKLSRASVGKEPDEKLLPMPLHTDRPIKADLKRAGIPRWAPGGKVDFHALRTGFTTLALEAGANPKEAQKLARHSDPRLTMNVYARARDERLAKVVDEIGDVINPAAAAQPARMAVGAQDVGKKCPQDAHETVPSENLPMEKQIYPGGFEPTHPRVANSKDFSTYPKLPMKLAQPIDSRSALIETKPQLFSTSLNEKCPPGAHAPKSILELHAHHFAGLEALEYYAICSQDAPERQSAAGSTKDASRQK